MAEAAVAGSGLDRRRLVLLCVLGLAQLMVVLDLTHTLLKHSLTYRSFHPVASYGSYLLPLSKLAGTILLSWGHL